MTKKLAFIFPGQGAQYVGMGRDFYDHFLAAREVFEEASDILSQDMRKLIFEEPITTLSLTRNSQPTIFLTSVAILKTVQHQFSSIAPYACGGLSLGEYTALFAADKISFKEALSLVAARGLFMQQACEETESSMRVVLGLDPEEIQKHLLEKTWIANLNCPGQVVVAGVSSQLIQLEELLRQAGAKRVLPLDVSGAFHTPLMQTAQTRLEPLLKVAHLKESKPFLVMNVTGAFTHILDEIRNNLIEQVVSATKWQKCVETLSQANVSHFIEIGPSKTLAGMNRKIGVLSPTISVEKVEDLDILSKSI